MHCHEPKANTRSTAGMVEGTLLRQISEPLSLLPVRPCGIRATKPCTVIVTKKK